MSTKDQLSAAAAALGRKGGRVKSDAKTAAARANGKLGGRPKDTPEQKRKKKEKSK